MNNHKVLVELIVPTLDEKYNVYFPVNRRIGNIICLLNKILLEETNGLYSGNEKTFLYETEDILSLDKRIKDKVEIYKDQDKFILKPIKELNYIEIGEILEYTKLIYKNKNPYLLSKKNIIQY